MLYFTISSLSIECVDLTNKEDVPTIYWIQELTLFPSDKNSLINGSWLSDALITAGQKLLKDAYPHIGGLQPTILGMTLAFEVQRKQFVQVLHINENHWVTASNIGCPVATVDIFDSMRCTRLSFRAKAQIAAMLFTDQPEITVRFQPVQLQHGTSDCGVFSLAFATSLCGGQTPTQITYIQHQLRDHLCHCPENKTITPFPCQQQRKKAKQYVADMKFRVYCKCRQPEEGRMIECEDCKEWYHEDCVEVPSVIWQTNSHISWICDSCIKTLN